MPDQKCLECGANLYRGWHTNCPGESLGREADDVLCLMLSMQGETHQFQLARAKAREKKMADWLDTKSLALARALGLPESEQVPPMDTMIERVRGLREACRDMVDSLRYIRDHGGGLIVQHGDALDAGLRALNLAASEGQEGEG